MNRNEMKAYESDSSQLKGRALNVIHPRTIADVKRIVTNAKRIVVRGGGTGMAGGCVPQGGLDVVLDISKMDKIGTIDKERNTIEVEAGALLDELQASLIKHNLEFPVNPSSHAICTVGGMIATDAVGSRAIKYGKTSNWVKWIEIIDGNGELHRKGITELSDYIGMEGITGVIVKACLKLSPRKERTATLIKIEKLEDVIDIVHKLKRDETVSMIEFLNKEISKKLALNEGYHLIVEYENDSGEMKDSDYERLMELREEIYPMLSGEGYSRIEDPKILLDRSDKLIRWLEERDIPVFGHIGVGILHPCFNHDQEKYIPEMMTLVKRLGGQISGEHGIGLLKKSFVEMNDKKILINIKKRTDPLNKFNVGKVL